MTTSTKILVVDDEQVIREPVRLLLERDGYQVVAVDSGEAALRAIAEQEFDVALIDLKMPGIDGMQVLAELRRRWPATPAVVLTAYASLETAVQAVRQGAHDYLVKPCRTIDLRESLRTAFIKRQRELYVRELLAADLIGGSPSQKAPASGPPQAQVEPAVPARQLPPYHGLLVDAQCHVITLDGQPLDLTPTEFDLLAYLVSEAPRVVTPDELMRNVLEHDSEGWDVRDTMYSHIHHIRRKVKAATGRDVIRTVRGVGYTVCAT